MKLKQLLLMATLVFLSSIVFAGATQPFSVTVDIEPDTSGIASGDMVSARTSRNDIELIGCGIRSFDDGAGGATSFGFCQATDSDGEAGFCNTFNSALLDVMKATADYSFVTFSWNAAGECIRIGFSTQSFYLPKTMGNL